MLNQDYALQLIIFYLLLAHCYLLQLTKGASYICMHGVLRGLTHKQSNKAIPYCDDTCLNPVYLYIDSVDFFGSQQY